MRTRTLAPFSSLVFLLSIGLPAAAQSSRPVYQKPPMVIADVLLPL